MDLHPQVVEATGSWELVRTLPRHLHKERTVSLCVPVRTGRRRGDPEEPEAADLDPRKPAGHVGPMEKNFRWHKRVWV